MNKKDELSILINQKDPDLLIFNEILPKRYRKKKKLSEKDFAIEGYDFFIRSTVEGRGVVLYFKKNLYVQTVECLNVFKFDEAIWLRVTLKGTDSLLVGNIYRSPSSPHENNIALNELILKAVGLKDSHILIVGDFNYRELDWEFMQSRESIGQSSTLFMETIKDTFLIQHVTEYTRHRIGQASGRLDLLFSNEEEMITDLEYMSPIGASDHMCLCFNFMCYTELKPSDIPRPNFYKGDYSAMRAFLSTADWETVANSELVLDKLS